MSPSLGVLEVYVMEGDRLDRVGFQPGEPTAYGGVLFKFDLDYALFAYPLYVGDAIFVGARDLGRRCYSFQEPFKEVLPEGC